MHSKTHSLPEISDLQLPDKNLTETAKTD